MIAVAFSHELYAAPAEVIHIYVLARRNASKSSNDPRSLPKMTNKSEIQSLLRFLSQDAKIPLPLAMSKVKELQKTNLTR